jgi:hypothetical protein
MTDTMTHQNIDLSSWDILYIEIIRDYLYIVFLVFSTDNGTEIMVESPLASVIKVWMFCM